MVDEAEDVEGKESRDGSRLGFVFCIVPQVKLEVCKDVSERTRVSLKSTKYGCDGGSLDGIRDLRLESQHYSRLDDGDADEGPRPL